MIVTVFRSRLNPHDTQNYPDWAERMSALAATMPGYIAHKFFTAADGERVTIVEFDTDQHTRAWAMHPEHRKAQSLARTSFYTEFSLQVCELLRETHFPRD